MADEMRIEREDDLVTLAECSLANVRAQLGEIPELLKLEEKNPALASEIALIMRSEIRRVETEFSLMIMDLRKNFEEDLHKLPAGHMLNVLGEINAVGR